jgi:hypothetical protein
MPTLTDDELRTLLDQLEAVCAQAQELQRQIKAKMAESARANFTKDTSAAQRGPDNADGSE